ncbi:MAG: hypothetical protein FJ038_06310 [Chloroflexi bacterium]|nr:hypothetical protein [Chloroflexota bacterium]
MTDGDTHELVVLDLAGTTPKIDARVKLAGPATHIAISPAYDYVAVSSGEGKNFTLVDLATMATTVVPLITGEPGIMLAGSPLAVYHRNDEPAIVEVFRVADIVAGRLEPAQQVAIGPAGHGEVAVHGLNRVMVATDEGVDLLDVIGGGVRYDRQLPWNTVDRQGGRGYYARLGSDGVRAFSYLRIVADPDKDESWETWELWDNDSYIANAQTGEVRRTELGKGLVYRMGLGANRALYSRIHPDGDEAIVLDTDVTSPTFGSVLSRIPLPSLTRGPVAGVEPWSSESRRVTIMPDDSLGFVTAGGDSKVVVIDISSGAIRTTLTTPTPLAGGGYLLAVGPGMDATDTIGRWISVPADGDISGLRSGRLLRGRCGSHVGVLDRARRGVVPAGKGSRPRRQNPFVPRNGPSATDPKAPIMSAQGAPGTGRRTGCTPGTRRGRRSRSARGGWSGHW